MKILLIADPILPVPPAGYGGIERIVAGLVEEYRRRGHRVLLMAKAGSTAKADVLAVWEGSRVESLADTFRNARQLARIAQAERVDVVHSFARLGYLLGVLPKRVRKIMSYQRHVGGVQLRVARLLGGSSLSFTGCSEFICREGRIAAGSWLAVPNFVDTSRFDFTSRVAEDAPLVFLSRIESIKGAHLAIEIAVKAGRRLVLAGNVASSGPEADYFARFIAPHLGKAGIEWIGEVDDDQKRALLRKALALLVPIQWDEPFGIVFIEALAAGTPVITCARGATPEIIEPGRTGFFITSVDDGVEAVGKVHAIHRAECRQAVERRFDVRTVADRYLQLYTQRRA